VQCVSEALVHVTSCYNMVRSMELLFMNHVLPPVTWESWNFRGSCEVWILLITDLWFVFITSLFWPLCQLFRH